MRYLRARWYRPAFFLTWHRQEVDPKSQTDTKFSNRVSLICLDYSPQLYHRLATMMGHTDAYLVLQDPYLLYVMVIVEWYQWNLDTFNDLRRSIASTEHIANNLSGPFEPNFPELHNLGRDASQATEICQASINVLELLIQEHTHLFEVLGDRSEVYDRTRSTLASMLVQFKGTLSRSETLEKRLANLINLVQ